MGSLKAAEKWYALFFGSYRRQPFARQYRYRHNVPRIRNAVLGGFRRQLKGKDIRAERLECTKSLEEWPVKSVQQLLVRDINRPLETSSCLQLLRKVVPQQGEPRSLSVFRWAHVAPIFRLPLSSSYAAPEANVDSRQLGNVPFEFQNTVKLVSTDGSKELGFIAWPDPIYSLSCQGLGVPAELFEQLTDSEFLNPADNSILKVHEVSFVPEGCDAVGLFPAYSESHREVFTGLQLFGSLIRRNACIGHARDRIKSILTSFPQERTANAAIDEPFNSAGYESDITNLKSLLAQTRQYKLLWSTKKDKNKICPGDIIRNTLSSEHISNSQLEQEFCKHYILFSIFSQTLRIQERLGKEPTNPGEVKWQWKPSDIFIWKSFEDINRRDMPSNVEELLLYKERYDGFLALLNSYHLTVMAEMKSLREDFYATGTSPRALPTLALLGTILRKCKPIRAFNPNLTAYFDKKLPPLSQDLQLAQLDAASPGDVEVGHKVNSIITNCVELEHLIYADNFTTTTPIQSEPLAPLTDWKFVIMSKKPLPPDVIRTVMFNSRIFTQFVTDLTEVTRRGFSVCKSRRMIDGDTFIFLYKHERPKRATREELVSDIIDKLEDAATAKS